MLLCTCNPAYGRFVSCMHQWASLSRFVFSFSGVALLLCVVDFDCIVDDQKHQLPATRHCFTVCDLTGVPLLFPS